MRFCLDHSFRLRCAGMVLCFASVAPAASLTKQLPPHVRSVVRADAHGRLVRTVIVTPRIQPKASNTAETSVDTQASSQQEFAEVPNLVEEAAKRHDVDPLLVHSVIQVESNYNPYAVSPKGAQGLMQLMPETARRFGVRNSFDIKENIEGGVRYLKYLGTLFPQDPRLTVAAYNAGEGAVWKYGNSIPPYRETVQYVDRVGKRYGQARRAAEKKEKKETKRPAGLETARAATTSEPEETHAPVRAFVDSEGRLHLRNVPAGSQAEQNP
jgi:hypothetical protein